MREDLVDHGRDAAVVEDVVQVRALEVRHADRAQLARVMGLLQRAPRFEIALEEVAALAELGPGLRTVDEHQVDVIKPERLQRSVDALFRLGVALALGGELGGHEHLVSRDAAGAHAFAHAALVLIGLGGVDVAIADLDGVLHHLRAALSSIRQVPSPSFGMFTPFARVKCSSRIMVFPFRLGLARSVGRRAARDIARPSPSPSRSQATR